MRRRDGIVGRLGERFAGSNVLRESSRGGRSLAAPPHLARRSWVWTMRGGDGWNDAFPERSVIQ